MRKGSITIFSLLSMILVATLLFTLIEGARYQELKRLSKLQTKVVLESVFAGYNSYLWEEYHLLAVDRRDMEEKLYIGGNGRVAEEASGLNVLGFQVDSLEVNAYTLLGDAKGDAYIKAVSTYMKKNLFYEVSSEVYEQYEQVKEIMERNNWSMSPISEALEELDLASTPSQKQSVTSKERSAKKTESLLISVKEAWDKGILNLVFQDTAGISSKQMDSKHVLSTRSLQQGKNSQVEEVDWLDRIMLQQYFLNYMSNYKETSKERALDYELEYLIGGSLCDTENLKIVATQLLELRAAINCAYLLSDEGKMQEVDLLAITIVGSSGTAFLVGLVKTALIAAWALAEAVLDVRAILDGKKIPLFKDSNMWTLDIEDIGSFTDGYAMAKTSPKGIDYEGYMGILLLFQEKEALAMRAMSVQESAVCKVEGFADFQIDSLMIWADAEISYKCTPLFLFWGTDLWGGDWAYDLYTREAFGY